MDRRDFIKGAGAAGLLAAMGPGSIARAAAAVPRGPAGKPLGQNETLLVFNAKPVDVVGRKLFGETAILVRGGNIEQRLSGAQAASTDADRKIDAGGRYVIPGLINCHCHMTVPGVLTADLKVVKYYGEQVYRSSVDCVLHGVTTVRDQGGEQLHIIDMQEKIGRGELMGPRILRGIGVQVPGGYGFYAPKFIQKNAVLEARNVAETKDAVARAVDLGTDHIKLLLEYASLLQGEEPLPLMTDEMLTAAVEKAASFGKTCAVHHSNLDGHRRALKVGIQSFEHMPIDGNLTDEDVQKFIDAKRVVVPTASVPWALCFPLTGDENFNRPNAQRLYADKKERIDAHIEEFAVPPLVPVGKKTYRKYASPGYFDKKHWILTPSARYFNSAAEYGGLNTLKMYKAGCRMGVGNDGGISFLWPGSMPLEMYLNQELGLKPGDIIYMATAVNSEIIAMEKSLGTLDAGKIADMVMYDANPLESIDNLWKPAAVLQSGRLVHSAGVVVESVR